ncbi:MAG: hypothetical protein EA360_05660, partial [Balneolaceae bacterium]
MRARCSFAGTESLSPRAGRPVTILLSDLFFSRNLKLRRKGSADIENRVAFTGIPATGMLAAGKYLLRFFFLILLLPLLLAGGVYGQVSGSVTLDDVGLEGVTIELSGANFNGENPSTVLTDSDGNFVFNGNFQAGNRSWTITPSKDGYTFEPASSSVTLNLNNTSWAVGNFVANVVVGNASQIAVALDPTSVSVSGTSTLTATVLDAGNNPVEGVTVNFASENTDRATVASATGTTNASGVATVEVTALTTAGTVDITGSISDADGNVDTSASDSATLTITAGNASQIRVETAADGSGTVVGAQDVVSGDAITVWAIARDASDNFVELVSDATWSLQSITGGVVSGDLVDNADGSATFTGALTGSATIRASSGALTAVESGTITVIAGAADQLAFGQQPGTTEAGESITPAVTVQVLDAAGNLVSGDNTTEVAMAIGTNPSSGTLSGTSPVTASGGVATFSDLSIDLVGSGYTLQASASGLTPATSSAFEITATPSAEFTITGTITDGTDPLEGVSV